MHNVEEINNGKLVGWIGGSIDGRPSSIGLACSGKMIEVFATKQRLDVLQAGYTLFSGFDMKISAYTDKCDCRAHIEKKFYKLTPSVKKDDDLINIDEVSENHISGWVNNAEGLYSLCFFDASGVVRSEINSRWDVNAHLKTPQDVLHGFRAEGVDVSTLVAVSVNNSLIHWFTPGWLK